MSFWAGLHDIGKVSPSFQVKVTELFRKMVDESPEYGSDEAVPSLGHHEVTHWSLVQILRDFGYKSGSSPLRDVGHQVAQILGGHHARFCAPISQGKDWKEPLGRTGVGAGRWDEERRRHAGLLRRLTGAEEGLDEHLPPSLVVLALGVIVVADWLVSQTTFIEPRLPGEGWRATEEEVQAHWERALADAPQLIAEAGIGAAEFLDLPFSSLFGFEPNKLQLSLVERLPAMVDGAGMLLVTAPPGDGKTEAALYSAGVLGRASRATGLGFCLPTMATTDAMHRRVQTYLQKAFAGSPALTKVHSMAWPSRDGAADAAASAAEAPAVASDREASEEATKWLHTGQRGLLAPISTSQFNQMVAGVLHQSSTCCIPISMDLPQPLSTHNGRYGLADEDEAAAVGAGLADALGEGGDEGFRGGDREASLDLCAGDAQALVWCGAGDLWEEAEREPFDVGGCSDADNAVGGYGGFSDRLQSA
ncbi:CRISPR-associated endonuclease Cas3-HD [Actinocorallia herbida]|uniref:CRISPR-associated endonuclease Cas3-HD n=1 Tax=Actinocorallia herbida TaxID=58109 RepID=A0A3N1CT26_9ACTN|nr:CRISPR-associated endonuclease Cas3-HD [Actinocorallia herbida]